jgi:UDP-N-acetylmuramoylalanine--D-glutamate ligase
MFKNKKVLIFGLGILGGGLASVEYFIKHRAILRITDLKTKDKLDQEIKKINRIAQKYNYDKKIVYILGKHRKEDFDWSNIVVVNPAISYKNEFVRYALKRGKLVINDCYLFFKNSQGELIALTGTRGKTTTTYLIYQLFKNFISKKIFLAGNQPDKSLLKIIDKTTPNSISILELSSFQLEFYQKNLKAPKIAIITNIYEDHLNRYQNMEEYAKIKAKIFSNQNKDDFLILNYDNPWIKYFLSLKPKSKIYFISFKELPSLLNGLFIKNNYLLFRNAYSESKINLNIKKIIKNIGKHNLSNLMIALLTLIIFSEYKGIKLNKNRLKDVYKILSFPSFRQELIYKNKNLIIINDSASTAPQATLEAINRFFKKNINLILIIGGTDKNLDYQELSTLIKQKIKNKNLIILQGSASNKIIAELKKLKYNLDESQIFNNLSECTQRALQLVKKNKKNIILFSPAAASFEKFKNEFDRGEKFNQLIKNFLK